MNRPIALLTDFGLTDHYVGSIKSVILDINPKAVIYDITHNVRPQNIREGAFLLHAVYPLLPKGSIVVAVIDPGVGSERQAVCIQTKKGFLLAPDNGLLSMALDGERHQARKITNDRFFRKPVSATFHGRDIFSPCAAWLSKKDIFNSLGPKIKSLHQLKVPKPRQRRNVLTGEIIYIDRFGNVMTNIVRSQVKHKRKLDIRINKRRVSLVPFFSAGRPGELIALWNSSDILELAVPNDSAEKKYKLQIGNVVEIS